MSDAHQALSYTISADDRASAVFRGVAAELRQVQSLARQPLAGLNKEWQALGSRRPLEIIKAEQAVQIARTEQETRKLTKAVADSGVATKLQAAELDLLARRHQSLQKELAKSTTAHATLKKAGDVAAVGILGVTAATVAGSVKQGIAWEQLGKTIAQQTGLSGKSLESLMGTISNLQGTVPFKLADVSSAAVLLRTRFKETDPQIEKTDAKLVAFAKRAEMEVTPAARGLANVLRDFREPLGDVTNLMDEMVSVSQLTQQPLGTMESTIERFGPKLQAMGFGLHESIRLMGILGESGVKADQMGRGLSAAYGAAQKALGGAAGPQQALEKQADAVRKAQERLALLGATIPKTRLEQERHDQEIRHANEALSEAQKKYSVLTAAIKEAGGAHATVGGMVRAEIEQIEHAKSSQEAYSIAAGAFGRMVGPAFARAFFHNKEAIEATDHALHRHGSTQKLVEEEQKSFEGQVTELNETWHKTERELGTAVIPMLKSFLGVIGGGAKDLEHFVKENKTLAEILGGGLAVGAAGYLARGPIGGGLNLLSKVPGLGGLSKIPGVGGGSGEMYGILGASKPGSRTNPIAVWEAGGGPNTPGTGPPGAPPAPEKRIPIEPTPGEKGLIGKLLSADHPLRTAGVLTSALSGFAAAGAPGVKQDPADIVKAFTHGADPTTWATGLFNKVFGTSVPSVTGALGIIPNKLGFDPYERPDLAVRYMLTGILPTKGATPHTDAARSYAQDPTKRGPGSAQALPAGASPVLDNRPVYLSPQTATALKALRELRAASEGAKEAQEQINTQVQLGQRGSETYKTAVQHLAEAEKQQQHAVEDLQRASDRGAFLTPAQKQQLTDFRNGLNISRQAQIFKSDRGDIEGNIARLEARLKQHPTAQTQEAVTANYKRVVEGIQTEMGAGLVSVQKGTGEINKTLEQEAKALGVTIKANAQTNFGNTPAPSGPGAAFGPGLAKGGRVPGPVTGDTWTLVDPGGRPAAKVGGAELLIANRHTEADISRATMAVYGKTAGELVAGERTPHAAAPGRRATGGYVFPFPKGEQFGWDRIDQGQDLKGPPGGPVLAIGPGTVSVGHDAFSGFGPFYAVETLSAGPWKGRGVYYGHTKDTRTGPVRAGDVIALTQSRANEWTAAPAGWLELGFTSALGQGIQGQGSAVAPMLHALAEGHMVAGGAGAATIRQPKWTGPGGLVGQIGKAALAKVTAAANRRLGRISSTGGLPHGGGGTHSQNEALGRRMMLQAGWPASEWPALQALWTEESGWDANSVNPSSGAYGIPQSLGHGHPYNLGDAAAQIAWGLNYIRGRYGSPSAAEAHEKRFNWYEKGGRVDFAGAFGDGGSVTATKPTVAIFGDKGPETATFVPHAALGTRVGASGLAETPGNNPDTGQIEYHTQEDWAEIRRQHTARAKRHHGAKPTFEDLVRVGGMPAGTVTLTSSGGIDVPGDVGKLSTATWKKVVAAIEKTIKGTSDERVAVSLAGKLAGEKPSDPKTRDRLRSLTTKSIEDAASSVVRLTKATPQEEALGAGGGAISSIGKLIKDARRSNNTALIAVLRKDAEWAFKWTASTIMRTASEAPAGQAAGAAGTAVSQLTRLLTKAQAEGRRTVELGLIRDIQKTVAGWHTAISNTLSKRQEVAKAGVELRVATQTLAEMRSAGPGAKIKAGTARDATFVKQEEAANNKAIAEMQKEQAALSAMIKREQTLLGRLNAKLHRELKRHHKAAAHVIQLEINQIQAALGEAQSQMEEVAATIQQTETSNANLAAEQMKAAYEAFKEEVDEVRATLEQGRERISTAGVLEEGKLHREGKDFAALQEAKSEQEGTLTPAQIKQAQEDLAAYKKRKQEEISSEASQRAYDESALAGLSGEDRRNMERQIEELTRGISELESAIVDQEKATKKLTEATNANTKVFGGTVGFSYNGQQYVAGGQSTMSSVSGADIMTGV
jgi:hypothetical protein